MGDWSVLVHVGLEPSTTDYDITSSIVSFDLRLGLQYAPDYLDVVFKTPIIDTLGNTYTWGSTLDYNTQIRIISPNGLTYFVGYITSYEVDGEVAKARLMQSYYFQGKYGFTGSFSSSTQSDISNALEAATGIDMQEYVGYAPFWASNPITGVSYKNTPIPQILQRLYEITDSTNHYLQVNWIGPYAGRDEAVLMTGTYGGMDATSVPMTLDNVLLSAPEWKDNRDRVINSVTVKYTGGEVTSSDATSISNYRESSTTIYRPEYNNSTDAMAVADSILYQLKDPKESCRVKLDFGIFDAWGTHKIGGNLYRITDGVSGKSVDLPMREAIIHYPSLIADCTFDQLGLNTDEYVINTENRINVLEANQPNQPLDVTSAPTFAGATVNGNIAITGTVDGVDVSSFKSDYDSKINQSVKTTSSPTFAASTINGNLTITGTVDGVDVSAFKSDYDSKIDQAVKTTSSPTFTAVNIGADTQLYRSAANVLSLASGDALAINGTSVINSTRNLIPLTAVSYSGNGTDICYLDFGDASNIPASVRFRTPSRQMAIFLDTTNADADAIFGIYQDNAGFSSPYSAIFEAKVAGTYVRSGSLFMGTTAVMDSSRNLTNIGNINGAAVINSTGYVDQPKNIMCKAYASGTTSITAGNYVKVALAGEEYDANNTFASNKFTAPVAGKYLVCAQVQLASVADGKAIRCIVVKNCTGGDYPTTGTGILTSTSTAAMSATLSAGGSTIINLAANDYLELWAYNSDTSNRNASSGADVTFLAVHYLGA